MIKLSNERIEQILHEETVKKEKSATILRGIYNRYMRLYEDYFADIDALNDDKIAEFRNYHEETRSLVRYYYMDIPLDICKGIEEFENKYTEGLLGKEWHKNLFDRYKAFIKESKDKNKSQLTDYEKYCQMMAQQQEEEIDEIISGDMNEEAPEGVFVRGH